MDQACSHIFASRTKNRPTNSRIFVRTAHFALRGLLVCHTPVPFLVVYSSSTPWNSACPRTHALRHKPLSYVVSSALCARNGKRSSPLALAFHETGRRGPVLQTHRVKIRSAISSLSRKAIPDIQSINFHLCIGLQPVDSCRRALLASIAALSFLPLQGTSVLALGETKTVTLHFCTSDEWRRIPGLVSS